MNGTLGNTSTIKAYAANDSLYLEEERGPEYCHQKNKFSFSTVLLYNPIKAFFSVTARRYERLLEKKIVG